MEADFAIELGADDEVLEIPWAAADGSLRYYDLKQSPELLGQIKETEGVPELGNFLLAVNSASGRLASAKCDLWSSDEIGPAEDIFSASMKFGGYVDLWFAQERSRLCFELHEAAARQLVRTLQQAPEPAAAAEFLVRRCYYGREPQVVEGFYITFYLFGYGSDEAEARRHWGAGLRLAEMAIRQLSES
jgi:hypothetical protein